MITSSDLAMTRLAQNTLMPETVEVVRSTAANDGAGGRTLSSAVIATVSGRISEVSASDAAKYGEIVVTAGHIVTLPYGTNVLQTDQIRISGVTYEIVSILPRSYQTALRLAVRKL